MVAKPRKTHWWRSVCNFFLPHHSNRRHPHLLRREIVGMVLALVILVEFAFLLQAFTFSNSTEQLSAVLPSVVVALTNQQRATDQLGSVTINPLLNEAAQEVADDMAAKEYFAHVNPEGKTPWYWLGQVGYQYQSAGENLAVNFDDSQQLMNAWMASPSHRANILGSNYTQIGIGMATGTYQGQQVVFVVQYFASPLAATVAEPSTPQQSATQPTQEKVIPVAPTVAAAQTPPEVTALSSVVQTQPHALVSLWERIMASPRTYATYILAAIAVFFALLIVLAFMPFSKHTLRPQAAMNGLVAVAIVIGILIVNQRVLFKGVSLPTDNESASVAASQQ